MRSLSFASRILLCAVPLAVTALQSIPATADDGGWHLECSFLCDAWDIALDSQHNVYVMSADRIRVFTAEGEFLREKTGLDYARGIAIDENDVIYFLWYLHRDYTRLGRVERFDLDFQPLGAWTYAQSDLQAGYAIDVRDGIAYIGAANGLLKFATDGVLLDTFEGAWRSVQIIPDGSVWVARDPIGSGHVRHYSAGGDMLDEWYTDLPGELSSGANDIALDSNQRVFVADGNAMLLKIFRADGTLDDTLRVWPHTVALDGDDATYVGGAYPSQLMKFVYTPLSVEPATWGGIKAAFEYRGPLRVSSTAIVIHVPASSPA